MSVPNETKQCPWCAEIVQAAAKKCKHCGVFLDEDRGTSNPNSRSARLPMRAAVSLIVVFLVAVGVTVGLLASRAPARRTPPPPLTQAFHITSLSMYPTLQTGYTIIVNRDAYESSAPAMGDVIVFGATAREQDMCDSPGTDDLVKRIVGVPGDTIWSVGNIIYVDGKPLDQSWPHVAQLGTPIVRQTLPRADYFVLGDNEPASCDSRVWGYVPRGNIVGKAIRWISSSRSGGL
jgi:signal peptidase I